MNANSTLDMIPPKWLWMGLGVGIMMLTGAIWWASSGDGASKPKVDVQEYTPPIGAGPEVPQQPYAVVPPGEASPPWVNGDSSSARVNVTPMTPATPPQPVVAIPAKPAVKPKYAHKSAQPLRDMFPVGPIAPRAPRQTVQREETRPAIPEETFPGFHYGGTTWSFTGAFADASQLQLTPTGLELGGRSVLVLSNSAGPASILFVQSLRRPGMYAIYR